MLWVLLFLLAYVWIFGPMTVRLVSPMPAADLRAIEVFVRDRNQALAEVQKIWLGGPIRRLGFSRHPRPYRVDVIGDDGGVYIHNLAAGDQDDLGHPRLVQLSHGVWLEVVQ